MTDVIYITGAKGGCGATTCAVMIGAALAGEGERTLVVDGDCECAGALAMFGLSGLSVYTLADAERGACRIKQAILQHPKIKGLYVMPTLGCENVSFAEEAICSCAGLFDRVVCDNVALGACNRAIMVSEPYSSTLSYAQKKSARLRDGKFKKTELIINKINGGLVFGGEVLTPQEIAEIANCELIGVIPEDLSLPLGKVDSSTYKAFEMCARKIVGKDDKIYGIIRRYTGIKGLLKRRLRKVI